MKPLFITTLDKAINHALRLDSDTIARLATLEGKVIEINITDWSLTLFMLPYDYGVQILSSHESPDAIISTTLAGLMRYASASHKAPSQDEGLQIKGDVRSAQTLHHILQKIDIDWEEHLSRWTGDSFAHSACQQLSRFKQAGSRIIRQLSEHTTEYLQVESDHLPTSKEVNHFTKEVNTLRDSVARLEAKINLIELRTKRDKNHE